MLLDCALSQVRSMPNVAKLLSQFKLNHKEVLGSNLKGEDHLRWSRWCQQRKLLSLKKIERRKSFQFYFMLFWFEKFPFLPSLIWPHIWYSEKQPGLNPARQKTKCSSLYAACQPLSHFKLCRGDHLSDDIHTNCGFPISSLERNR